ncbi:hypothetical protein BB561_005108 [Smittium simulii]|uniref:Large ribosomal subunit protein uL3m n=1 Tax=Smittium simulii TaxID=133385 RepID=A0A2T9YC99_9FUNG|nr:hypothetical protein BB561_005108 [Smittium simulii]
MSSLMHSNDDFQNSAQEIQKVEKVNPEAKTWKPTSRRVGVLAKKLGMTSMWDEWGIKIPVTVLQIENVQVIKQIKTSNDNFPRLQVGAFTPRPDKVTKPLKGHFEKYNSSLKSVVTEFPVTPDAVLPSGTEITVAHFVPGQLVDVIGKSKGKGFAGVMKRWGFGGGRASHGVSLAHRTPGSIGQNQDPGRVFPGKKMPGRMGNQSVTVMELKVMKIDTELNCLYIKGHVPGNKRGIVKVRDAIKTNSVSKFPSDITPPFPTYIPGANGFNPLPREMVARVGGKDPLLLTK